VTRRSLAAFAHKAPAVRRARVSSLEAKFDQVWKLLRPDWAPLPVAELRFAPPRRWRFDRAFPLEGGGVAVELEGGVYTRGRHTRATGYVADIQKYNRAQLNGWLCLRFTAADMKNPLHMVDTIVEALRLRGCGHE
jgi:hypothetical protein